MVAVAAAPGARRPSPSSNKLAASHGLHEQKASAAFRAQKLAAVPSDLLTLKNLVRIDLSMNQITRFPGAFVAAEMLRLEVLQLQDNLLYVLEDVLALAPSPRLRELDLQRNPLRLQSNRVYLLEALFSEPGSDESLLTMAQKDEQLKFHDTSNDSTVMPGRKKNNMHKKRAVVARAPTHTTMKYRSKLPRKRGFPMLQRLNGEWITDSEVKDVESECGHAIEYFKPPAQAQNNSSGEPKSTKKKALRPQTAGSKSEKGVGGAAAAGRRFDGSRMTIKQMLKNEARSAGIPVARVIQRVQIDAENGDEVSLEGEEQEENDCSLKQLAASNRSSSTRRPGGSQSSILDTTKSRTLRGTADDGNDTSGDLEDRNEEQSIIHRLFQLSTSGLKVSTTTASPQPVNSKEQRANLAVKSTIGGHPDPPAVGKENDDDGAELEPWNYSISTFDTLNSEERQYVRYKSKQIGSTIERDDHFFDSSVFLDCVAQAERSRRLTVRAMDLLSQQHRDENGEVSLSLSRSQLLFGSQSTLSFPTCSAAASTLVDSMNAKFTKQLDQATYEKILAFQEKQLSVDSLHIQAAVGDYYQSEHVLQKQRNNQVLHASHPHHQSAVVLHSAAAIETTIENSLSKLKLRNAVDLANTLLDPKQQKRMLQTLIDADEKVIEEERIAQEQTAHKCRLHLINTRSYTPHDNKQVEELARKVNNTSESPWQRRNWKAIEVQQQKQQSQQRQQQLSGLDQQHLPQSSSPSKKANHSNKLRSSSSSPAFATEIGGGVDLAKPEVSCHFRSIETVEKAAQDALPGVNSHDLLVRCSEIRQRADKHMKALHVHRDRFLEGEAEWERMRQDPTNLVRKHLKRRLYQHAQEVQIGSTQFFYSSLFN